MKKVFTSFILILLAFVLLLLGLQNLLLCEYTNASAQLDLESKSALLMEYDSGEILFSKDSQKHLPVASMVKMMTILIALEEYDKGNVSLDTKITTTENASSMGGSQVFLDPFVDYTFEDLFKSVVMASANDASVALAEYFNGNEKTFTNRMNKKAKELGMIDTHYSNCTGLPAPEQYSSAKDTAILLKEILKHDIYHNYSSIWMDELVHPSGRKTGLTNTNRLIRYYQGCDGGKTGSTNEAGCCLGASAKRNDMRLISVIVGAPNSKTRFNESSILLNYGFGNFESKKLVDSTKEISNINILKGVESSVKVYAKENFVAVMKKDDNSGYKTDIRVQDFAKAPLKKGDVVGEIVVTKNSNIVRKIALIVKDDIRGLSLIETAKKVVKAW